MSIDRAGGTVIALTTAITVCIISPTHAQTQRIRYEYYVFATGGDVPIQDDGTLNGETELYGEYTHVGEPLADNYATIRFFADMNKRAVAAYAYSTGSVEGFWPYGFTATGRVERIGFEVDFDFTVPAGTYPTGVDVSLPADVTGSLWASSEAGTQVNYYLIWGTDQRNPGLKEIGVVESASIYFSEPCTLTTQIVSPGAVLGSPTEYRVSLSAYITNLRTSAALGGTSPNYVTGSAGVHMYTGIRFGDVSAPPGVTWETPDSVFIDPPVGVGDRPVAHETARLEQNYPNPFNPMTTISYYLPEAAEVTLAVYDIRGRLVRTLKHGPVTAGAHDVVWMGRDDSGREVASGVYFYRLSGGGLNQTRKTILLK